MAMGNSRTPRGTKATAKELHQENAFFGIANNWEFDSNATVESLDCREKQPSLISDTDLEMQIETTEQELVELILNT
jgi:hypothetical protein